MKLTVTRVNYTPLSTTGVMLLDGEFFGYTLEDTYREGEKLMHQTAIPPGRYGVTLTMSNRFKRILPLLLGVPGFSGVRIHGGNTAADTSGCLLIAQKRTSPDMVFGSLSNVLVAQLQAAGGQHEIEILNAWRPVRVAA